MAELSARGDAGPTLSAAAASGQSIAQPRRLRRRDVFLGAGAGVVAGGLLGGLNWFDAQSRLTVPEPIFAPSPRHRTTNVRSPPLSPC